MTGKPEVAVDEGQELERPQLVLVDRSLRPYFLPSCDGRWRVGKGGCEKKPLTIRGPDRAGWVRHEPKAIVSNMASKPIPNGSNLEVDVGAPPVDLTGAVVSGVRWKAMTRVVSSLTRLLVLVILARLLTPTDYGIAGMAIVVTSFALIFTDPALSAALIQRPVIDERDRSSVFWLATGIGGALTLVGVAASGLVANFFREEQVQDLVIVTSFCLVAASLSVTQRALLARELAYRKLEIREMTSIVAGGVVGVAAAIAGLGPWAIVLNFVTYVVISTVLVWLLVDWRPRRVFSIDHIRSLWGFSARIFSASVLTWGNQNLDKALVGRFLGGGPLGAYSLAYTATQVPGQLLSRPLYQVVAPAYARIQSDSERLERAWLWSKQLSVAVVAPALLALIVVAPDLVPVVFGDQWDAAIAPLQLLCIGAVANALVALHWSVLQARGEASTVLRLAFMSSFLTFTAFACGLYWGIVGVAAFYAGARWLYVVPSTWITTRGVSFAFWPALRAGGDMLPTALVAAAVGFATRILLLELDVPQAIRLIVVTAVIFLVDGVIVALTAPSVMRGVQLVVPIPARVPLFGGRADPQRASGTPGDRGYDEVGQPLGRSGQE